MEPRELSYFNLLTTGVGYLNQIKEVTPEEGMPFLVVKIAALRGKPNDIKKTYFSSIVSGAHAHEWVRLLADAVIEERKVLFRFRLSDLEGSVYPSDDSDPNNPPRVTFNTRLIGVDWARVDGKVVRPDRRVA